MARTTARLHNPKRFDVDAQRLRAKHLVAQYITDRHKSTPGDSDSMDRNMWLYISMLLNDIENKGFPSNWDSEDFRSDSDGNGFDSWEGFYQTSKVADAYAPLKRFMYGLDSDFQFSHRDARIYSGGAVGTPNKYRSDYAILVGDSEGQTNWMNIYTFLKLHMDRFFQYDPFERNKMGVHAADGIVNDSDAKVTIARSLLGAIEADSDLIIELNNIVSKSTIEDLIPRLDDTFVLGTSALSWRELWVTDLIDLLGDLEVDGDADIGGTMDIGGNTTVGGTMDIVGATSTGPLTTAGLIDQNGAGVNTFEGDLDTDGDVVIRGGDLTFEGVALTALKPMTISDSAGAPVLAGYLWSTSTTPSIL